MAPEPLITEFVGVTYGRRFHKLVTITEGTGFRKITYQRGACGAYLKGRALLKNVEKKQPCQHCWPNGVSHERRVVQTPSGELPC